MNPSSVSSSTSWSDDVSNVSVHGSQSQMIDLTLTSTNSNRKSHVSLSSSYSPKDILYGRGGLTNNHSGNRVYRRLISEKQDFYRRLTDKNEKALLARSIFSAIRTGGGRFLRRTGKHSWEEVSDKNAISKISQALRETRDRKDYLKHATANKAGASGSGSENDDVGSVSSVRRGRDSDDNDSVSSVRRGRDSDDNDSDFIRSPMASTTAIESVDHFRNIGADPLILPEREESLTFPPTSCYNNQNNSNNIIKRDFAPPDAPTRFFNEIINTSTDDSGFRLSRDEMPDSGASSTLRLGRDEMPAQISGASSTPLPYDTSALFPDDFAEIFKSQESMESVDIFSLLEPFL